MKVKINRFLAAIIILTIAAIIFILIYVPGYSRYQELKRRDEALQEEIRYYDETNSMLLDELNLLKTDITHLEKVLRDRMGLVKPGEVIYKVVEEEANVGAEEVVEVAAGVTEALVE